MNLRIIAGLYRSRLLTSPKGDTTRPTSSIVRKALFDILGGSVEESDFLDLFAGTGAIGIEALSRYANSATFVESDRSAFAAMKTNVTTLKIPPEKAHLHASSVRTIIAPFHKSGKLFDFIYADPPYEDLNYYIETLSLLDKNNLLKPNGTLILELESKSKFVLPELECLVLTRERTIGPSSLLFFQLKSGE